MPRFRVKDLMLSTALIALGLGYICYELSGDMHSEIPLPEFLLLPMWIGSGSSIGAGIAHLFGKAWAGAVLGGIANLALFVYAVSAIP